MKLRFIGFLLIWISILPLQAIELSEKMYLQEKLLSWTTTFDVSTDEEKVGAIYRKFFTLTKQYHLEDIKGSLISKAISRFWSLGMIFDIEDEKGELLGYVEERILNILPTFEIFSPSGEKLAKAKLNFWGTTYKIKDPDDDHEIASFYRPYFHILNNWTITIHDMEAIHAKQIHAHMLMVIAALQGDLDSWRNSDIHYAHAPFIELLDPEREALQGIRPSEEDFLSIDRLDSDEALWLLESDQLTPQQKAALLKMVDLSFQNNF